MRLLTEDAVVRCGHIMGKADVPPTQELVRDHPTMTKYRSNLALAYTNTGYLQEAERKFDEARAALIRVLPKAIASLVSGTISASLDTPGGRLLADVRDQMMTVNRASAVSA